MFQDAVGHFYQLKTFRSIKKYIAYICYHKFNRKHTQPSGAARFQPRARTENSQSHTNSNISITVSHRKAYIYCPLTHRSDTQLHRKHTIHRTTQHHETSDRIKPNTDTHASITLTQTAGRGTGGRAEARLEGMKQIKEIQKACRG